MALITIGDGNLRATVNSLGAELSSLIDARGRELLWQGGEAWAGRAPVLFPIVGELPGNVLVHDGVEYPIGRHGFARKLEFAVSEVSEGSALFTLQSGPETLVHFPFEFRLDIRFTFLDSRLGVATTVTNTGDATFSASLGEHPGFAWPLVPGVAREAHTIEFAHEEPADIRRIEDGLLRPQALPTPVEGRVLHLDDALFVDDAIIFDELVSRSVRYTAPGAPVITVDFDDFPLLGVWSKAPGEFVCIEPWYGMTAPQEFSGEYAEKPGQFVLESGQLKAFSHGVSVSDE
jgi:galactose mutarotase-like enzyme